MIVKGRRRGGAKTLTAHLLRLDTNEALIVHAIEHYPKLALARESLAAALNLMELEGKAKGQNRTLYHAILAPQAGEYLNPEQLIYAVDLLADNLGLKGHARIIVEHHKSRRQHFHVVFNLLDPATDKDVTLKAPKNAGWKTSRQLEGHFGLKPVIAKGRSLRRWEYERAKRSGIDPIKMRKDITALYQACTTGLSFVEALQKNGYGLTKGRFDAFLLIDKAGDAHGLMRRIEGAKFKDLKEKFPDLADIRLPKLEDLQKARRPKVKPRLRGLRASWIKAGRFIKAPPILKPRGGELKPRFFLPSTSAFLREGGAKDGAEKSKAFLPFPPPIKTAMHFAAFPLTRRQRSQKGDNHLRPNINNAMERSEHIAWAFENGRADILAEYGIYLFDDQLNP